MEQELEEIKQQFIDYKTKTERLIDNAEQALFNRFFATSVNGSILDNPNQIQVGGLGEAGWFKEGI